MKSRYWLLNYCYHVYFWSFEGWNSLGLSYIYQSIASSLYHTSSCMYIPCILFVHVYAGMWSETLYLIFQLTKYFSKKHFQTASITFEVADKDVLLIENQDLVSGIEQEYNAYEEKMKLYVFGLTFKNLIFECTTLIYKKLCFLIFLRTCSTHINCLGCTRQQTYSASLHRRKKQNWSKLGIMLFY